MVRYVGAVAVVIVAIGVSALAYRSLTPTVFLLLYPAVTVAASYGGLGPGIVATVLATVGAHIWLPPPQGTFSALADDVVRFVAFLSITVVVSWITEAEQAARRRARARALESAELTRRLKEQATAAEEQLAASQQLHQELQEQQAQLTEARQLQLGEERRLRFVGEASRILGSALDYESTIRAVAQAFVPELSDWCAVDMLLEPGSGKWPPIVERMTVVHQSPEKVAWAMDLYHRTPIDWSADRGFARVIRTGEPEFLPVITDDILVAAAHNAHELTLLREVGLSGFICVPIDRDGHVVGAITLAMTESGRHYALSDLRLVQDVAGRAAVAIEHAELFQAAERARAEAEEANRAKTEFLAVMSHELRTPLNAIGGYSQLLELGVRGQVTAEQKKDLQRIQRSARHLLSLINQILNFAKLDAGQVPLEPRRVRLAEALADLEALVAPQLQAKGVAFQTAPTTDLVVWCDPEKLQQILLNLLSNAIKFTPTGGRVTLSSESEGESAVIRVEDTGPGIPPEKLERIFEPFVQLERGLTSSQEGAGLGLAISRELARAMGGELTAESAPSGGARFRLTLPRAGEARQSA